MERYRSLLKDMMEPGGYYNVLIDIRFKGIKRFKKFMEIAEKRGKTKAAEGYNKYIRKCQNDILAMTEVINKIKEFEDQYEITRYTLDDIIEYLSIEES